MVHRESQVSHHGDPLQLDRVVSSGSENPGRLSDAEETRFPFAYFSGFPFLPPSEVTQQPQTTSLLTQGLGQCLFLLVRLLGALDGDLGWDEAQNEISPSSSASGRFYPRIGQLVFNPALLKNSLSW